MKESNIMYVPNYYFTSDIHYGHQNIIQYSNRPFKTVEEMNETLINNINDVVKEKDILYYLGDLVLGVPNKNQTIIETRNKINCRNIHFIRGNHDPSLSVLRSFNIFSSVEELKEVKVNHKKIVLCHYAMRVWNNSHHGAWCLYAHSHNTLLDDPNALSIDIGMDTDKFNHKRFTPYSFDELKEIMTKHKTWKPIDHHLPSTH